MTPRDRRAIRLGLAVAAAALLALRVVPKCVATFRIASAAHSARRALLMRARVDLLALPLLEDSARVLAKRLDEVATQLVAGNTESEALAELSAQLRSRADRSHARLDRVDQLPDSVTAGRIHRLSAMASFEGDIRSVVAFLTTLGEEAPLILATRVQIIASDRSDDPKAKEVLHVQFQLAAWYLSRETS